MGQAGLFSAVTSAFILDVQSDLKPDFQEMSYELLKIVASVQLGKVPTGSDAEFPQWTGPDPMVVHVQTILYSSLAVSLLSAFIAMLGNQWLARYAQMEVRGSVVDRSRHRQRKMEGMVTWHFELVMECLPLMLQGALLLLGYALSNYLFFINKTIAGVVIGFTAFGLLFYCLIVSAATFSYNCPFQTPLSLVLRFMIRFFLKTAPRPKSGGPQRFGRFGTFDGIDHVELPMADAPEQPLFHQERNWEGYVLDSNCIAWMFEMSMDADVFMAIMRFIPEVIWHTGIRTIPIEGLYDTVLEGFDRSSGRCVVIPRLRNIVYLGAKALVHLAIQRKCIGDGSDRAAFRSISTRHPVMGHGCYEGDSDLEATLGIMDRIFGDLEPMRWNEFTFTIPHHAWMAHILLHHAWDILRQGEGLPDYIKEFVLHSLRLDPPPPPTIVVDCLFIVGLVLGIKLHVDDLLIADKRWVYILRVRSQV